MRLVLLGAPGAGKGTMAAELTKKYKITHISTGDIFRENIRDNTSLGQEAKRYMDQGFLVPDDITIQMVRERLSHEDCSEGFLLDGYPRTSEQALALEEMLKEKNQSLDGVIRLSVSRETIISRLSSRRVCMDCSAVYNTGMNPPKQEHQCDHCGGRVIRRDDDEPETIATRLQTYHERTAPLIEWYQKKGLIIDVNNEVSSKHAAIQAMTALDAREVK